MLLLDFRVCSGHTKKIWQRLMPPLPLRRRCRALTATARGKKNIRRFNWLDCTIMAFNTMAMLPVL